MPPLFSKRRPPGTRFVELDSRKCQACWSCVDACARQVIGKVSVLWHKHAVLRKGQDCVGCLKCVVACRAGALRKRIVAP